MTESTEESEMSQEEFKTPCGCFPREYKVYETMTHSSKILCEIYQEKKLRTTHKCPHCNLKFTEQDEKLEAQCHQGYHYAEVGLDITRGLGIMIMQCSARSGKIVGCRETVAFLNCRAPVTDNFFISARTSEGKIFSIWDAGPTRNPATTPRNPSSYVFVASTATWSNGIGLYSRPQKKSTAPKHAEADWDCGGKGLTRKLGRTPEALYRCPGKS